MSTEADFLRAYLSQPSSDAPASVDLATSSSPGASTKAADEAPAAKAPKKTTTAKAPKKAKVVEEFDPEGPIYDDCNEIRRKIRAHLAEGNKVTHFLREIGGVNSNSYQRFMALKGPDGGSGNSTYHCAYYFFEEKRIKEGKPKSAKRKKNETMWGSDGHSTETQRGGWYMM